MNDFIAGVITLAIVLVFILCYLVAYSITGNHEDAALALILSIGAIVGVGSVFITVRHLLYG